MKKTLILNFIFILILSTSTYAQLLGARYAGMGGTGIAVCDDIGAAVYNPAGLMRSSVKFGELKFGAGVAQTGMADLVSAISKASDPATFFSDNYSKKIEADGSFGVLIGGQISKIGLSLIPSGHIYANKPENQIAGSIGANVDNTIALTVGTTFKTEAFPLGPIDIGGNIKSITRAGGAGTAALSTSINTVSVGTGIGFDLGARADINAVAFPLTGGIVIKNFLQSINSRDKTVTATYNPDGSLASKIETPEITTSYADPLIIGLGVSSKVPVLGLLLAGDIETAGKTDRSPAYTNMHIGVEYPVLAGVIPLRAGIISGTNISYTTLGTGLHFGTNFDLAYAIDNKNNKNNQLLLEGGMIF